MLSTLNLTVTTLSDPSGPSGTVSLREAINTANADTVDSQVNIGFAAALTGKIDLTTALPVLNNNITINGPGATSLTVQRDPSAANFSIFTVNSGAINISGLTISGGTGSTLSSGPGSSGINGGGIITEQMSPPGWVDGNSLTVSGDVFANNSASSGGAIYSSEPLTVINSTFTDNTGPSISEYIDGAAIYDWNTLTITGSTFSNNNAGVVGNVVLTAGNSGLVTITTSIFSHNIGIALESGGSITSIANSVFTYNNIGVITYPWGSTEITDSTFAYNSELGVWISGTTNGVPGISTIAGCTIIDTSGDGIQNGGVLTVLNSTIAYSTGYGIYNDNTGVLVVTSSTIADNNIGIGMEQWMVSAFGDYDTSSITLNDSIVADSTFTSIFIGPKCDINDPGQAGPLTGSYNLIGIANPSLGLNSSNLAGTVADPLNPLIGPLQNNGGPTETMALLPGSPAIGTGSVNLAVDANGVSLQYDQRGPGYPRTTNGAIDIGAYEAPLLTPILVVTDNGGTYDGKAFAATVTTNGQSSLKGITPTLDYHQLVKGVWQDQHTTAPTNAGFYDVTAIFAGTVNYAAARSSTVDFTIGQATAKIVVTPYSVTYDGKAHSATGTATGVNGALPSSDLVLNTTYTNAGTYADTWIFTNPNYVSKSGKVTDIIGKANATIHVTPYNVVFNGLAHTATGYAVGVNGALLPGLNLAGTTHLGGYYTNTLSDHWTFTDTTGNYNSTSGIVIDTIRANPVLYNAEFHPFSPRSPFYGRFFMW